MLSMLGTAVALVFVPSLPAVMALGFLAAGDTAATGSYHCTYVIGMHVTVGGGGGEVMAPISIPMS